MKHPKSGVLCASLSWQMFWAGLNRYATTSHSLTPALIFTPYLCTSTCTNLHMHVCTPLGDYAHTHTHTHTLMNVHFKTCTHTYKYTNSHVHIVLNNSARLHAYTHIHTHIYIYILYRFTQQIYIHIRNQTQKKCLLCNGYRCRKWTRWPEFKSWTWLVAFYILLSNE